MGYYECVVMLGGGIGVDSTGQAVFADDGDRIRPVLQMWHAHQVGTIVVTGSSTNPSQKGPAEVTQQLLVSLGVPAENIVQIEGQNTSAEMRNLQQWLADSNQSRSRIGLVTSAFHLPRAMRLASSVGLNLEPITSASRANNDWVGWARLVVPTAGSLHTFSLCAKEWLAAVIQR
jgi:uncharacterized SAM-binding protein YcdF (DUF218 family)